MSISAFRSMRSSPTNTRSVSERSPMMFLTGRGNLRTNVGTARIWLSRASFGFFKRSITSIWYLPFNCSSQINLRLLSAVTALAVWPATYKRKTHLSLLDLAACPLRSTRRAFDRLVFDLSCLIFTLNPIDLQNILKRDRTLMAQI